MLPLSEMVPIGAGVIQGPQHDGANVEIRTLVPVPAVPRVLPPALPSLSGPTVVPRHKAEKVPQSWGSSRWRQPPLIPLTPLISSEGSRVICYSRVHPESSGRWCG